MANKSIKKNYIYNVTYQMLLLVVPFVTMPYLARVLGADGIGTCSYIESVVSYFVLFATFGVSTYGQREISYARDDIKRRSIIFWETKVLECFTAIVSFCVYVLFLLKQNNSVFYWAAAFNIIAVVTDVTWLFQGMEEFGKIILRNIFFKFLNVIYILVFIREKEDLILYLFGSAFFVFLSNTSLWIYIPKYINKLCIRELKPFSNIKVVLSLFVPTVAIQIYTVMDKTMIGIITNNSFENGYYEQAIRISKMVLAAVTALGKVMIPRIGFYFEHSEDEKVKKYMYWSYRFVWFLGIPLCLGMIGVSANFVGWFCGNGHEKVVPLLQILSSLILVIGISNVTGMQYLIPTKRQNIFTRTVLVGACINFAMNLVLIPKYGSIGAAVASVVAESVITAVQLIFIKKEISLVKIMMSSKNYIFAGLVMLILLGSIRNHLESSIMNTFMMILGGGITYTIMLIVLRDEFFLDNINKFKVKVKK